MSHWPSPSASPLPSYLLHDSREGGYPTELFDEKELEQHSDLICSICTSVCRNVVCCPTDCAALFCAACLTRCFDEGQEACPECRTELDRDDFQISFANAKQIRGLTVICPNGCGTAGLVMGVDERSIKAHLTQQCTRRPVRCPRGCNAQLQARHLAEHDDKCLLHTLACPNGCVESSDGQFLCHPRPRHASVPTAFQKSLLPHHIATECPNSALECPQCSVAVWRCEWEAHERSDSHLLKVAEAKIALLSSAVTTLLEKVCSGDSEEAADFRCNITRAANASFYAPPKPLLGAAQNRAAPKNAAAKRACRCDKSIAVDSTADEGAEQSNKRVRRSGPAQQ